MAWEPGLGRVLDSMPSHVICTNSWIFVGLPQQGVTGLVDDSSNYGVGTQVGQSPEFDASSLHELSDLRRAVPARSDRPSKTNRLTMAWEPRLDRVLDLMPASCVNSWKASLLGMAMAVAMVVINLCQGRIGNRSSWLYHSPGNGFRKATAVGLTLTFGQCVGVLILFNASAFC
jgi:hypothetical protein